MIFWDSASRQAANFVFLDGFKISTFFLKEYKYIKGSFETAHLRLNYQKLKRIKSKKLVKYFKEILDLYISSDKLIFALLTELLSPISRLERMKPVFIMLNNILKMFYTFDKIRIRNNHLFSEFAYSIRKCKKRLTEEEILKIRTLTAIAMPMGHMFISSFTYKNFEMFVPKELIKRNKIHLFNEKKNVFYFLCHLLAKSEYKYMRVLFCAAYKTVFKSQKFESSVEKLGESLKEYYYELLWMNN